MTTWRAYPTPSAGAAGAGTTGTTAQSRPDRPQREALSSDAAAKVKAAALAKAPGATIERTETNTDGSAPYESHIRTSDGKEIEVLVNKDFDVVGANERPARR